MFRCSLMLGNVGSFTHPENTGKIVSAFHNCTYPSQAHFWVYLSHCRWPAPANPRSMYNSVCWNLHNTSIVHQALCCSGINRGKRYRRADDLSGKSALSKQIQLVEGKAEGIFNPGRVRISNTALNSFQAWHGEAVATLTGSTETDF